MTTTEELRRLLDERGVEYYPKASDETVFITGTEHVHVQDDLIDGCLELFIRPVTPEQAIAATLGGGTCKNRDADIYPGGMVFVCSACEGMSTDGQPSYCPNCGRKVVE